MESLVASRVERIQALAREDPSETNKVQVEKELDILSSLCHHICPNLNQGERHPVVLLLIQLFPAVQTLINKWCRDHSIMEVCGGVRDAGEGWGGGEGWWGGGEGGYEVVTTPTHIYNY